ncbi:MAG TPA: hypothetical protein VHG72_21665 [Polyangia bacterium]|nr:hypothetical protein [Polyangia bacterium]
MGNPPGVNAKRHGGRDKTIGVRVTEKEYRDIERRAERDGLDASTWLRTLGLRAARDPSGYSKAICEAAEVGESAG